jgi:hypothetical protein
MKLVSPNDLQTAAKNTYLLGRDPANETEWALCVNYWAANVTRDARESACILLARIFDCPLSEKKIKKIVAFQSKQGKVKL